MASNPVMLTRQQAGDTVAGFLGAILSGPKLSGSALAVVLSALWAQFTGILATLLAFFFLVDLGLGILRAIHERGLGGFEWPRFWRAWIKMGAAGLGIALSTLVDLSLHQLQTPEDWFPVTAAALAGMCYGFAASGAQSFAYFWPEVGQGIERAIDQMRGGPADKEPMP
jgi:hypothetical protein